MFSDEVFNQVDAAGSSDEGPVYTLWLGAGNMSLELSSVREQPDIASFMVVTTYEDEKVALEVPLARENKQELLAMGVEVLHGIDATQLHKDPYFQEKQFQTIYFSHPHTGEFKTTGAMIKGFLTSAGACQLPGSEIHLLRLRGGEKTRFPETEDGPEKAAQRNQHYQRLYSFFSGESLPGGYMLVDKVRFDADKHPEYRHSQTKKKNKSAPNVGHHYSIWAVFIKTSRQACTYHSEIISSHASEADSENQRNRQRAAIQYRPAARRDNEGRQHKHFSKRPVIPEEFNTQQNRQASLGLERFEKNDKRGAQKAFKKLINMASTRDWSHVQLGWVLHRLHKYDEAIEHYEIAYRINPDNDEALRKWGWALDRQYQKRREPALLVQAIDCYQRAATTSPDNVEVYNNWGMALVKLRHFEEAEEKFLYVIEHQASHDEACVHLGDVYLKQKHYDEAILYYQRAILRNSQSDWAYTRLGTAQVEKHKGEGRCDPELLEEAQHNFKKALTLHAGNVQARSALSKLKRLCGEEQAAEARDKQAYHGSNPLTHFSTKHRVSTLAESQRTTSSNGDEALLQSIRSPA